MYWMHHSLHPNGFHGLKLLYLRNNGCRHLFSKTDCKYWLHNNFYFILYWMHHLKFFHWLQLLYKSNKGCRHICSKLNASIGCRHIVASIECCIISCIWSVSSFWNYHCKALMAYVQPTLKYGMQPNCLQATDAASLTRITDLKA